MLRICCLDHLCVCPESVLWQNGSLDDWIQMPFGVMSGVRFDMGVLDGGSNCRRGRGRLG